ncbi:MAG: tRNA dihydrouridine synthase DusB [Clostridia bacterium]|nr:tRNA dihydrouridine synthase DusB [Clostridia bacterium]
MPRFGIGDFEIKNGLVLAPMAGITDKTFRSIAKEYGADLTVSEMISAKGVYYKDKKTKLLSERAANEDVYAIQIFGSDPEIMAFAAKVFEEEQKSGLIIDINMGCPMPKITGNGEGSALMKDPKLCGRIVKAVSEAVKAPVTVKIRAGWDQSSLNAAEVAAECEANGAKAVCVHGRTREQLYRPPVDKSIIKEVKKALTIPVIANGGCYSGRDAAELLAETGCDGVALAQGAMGNPFIFEECIAEFNGRAYRKPEKDEIIAMASRHVRMLCLDKGEYIGVRESRKHLGWYIKGFAGSAEARKMINMAEKEEELQEILQKLAAL